MKDLGWVQKNLIPHLIDYTIECNYYSEGDFGSLYAITFESSQKGGYIHFWGSGWFGVDVYDFTYINWFWIGAALLSVFFALLVWNVKPK